MKLSSAFIKLPVRFDAARLAEEVAQFTASDWSNHPTGFKGNAAVRLISANGGENDDMGGAMRATPQLEKCPYIKQVLASFNVVFGRSRLMGLGPGCEVPVHSDTNYHWHDRVRIHIPVVTLPQVSFHCGDRQVHMASGEAWIFDNWRMHKVINPTDKLRIHLVADTAGSADFWRFVRRGIDPFSTAAAENNTASEALLVPYRPGFNPAILTENFNVPQVMPAGELAALVHDLLHDLRATAHQDAQLIAHFCEAAQDFCFEWRANWYLHGENRSGWPIYQALRQQLARQIHAQKLTLVSNGALAGPTLMGRVVLPCLNVPLDMPAAQTADCAPGKNHTAPEVATRMAAPPVAMHAAATAPAQLFDRPLIILTAPRSGSTLLFETLSQCNALHTIGGESHALIEALEELHPLGGSVTSNRLDATHATPTVVTRLRADFAQRLRDKNGHAPQSGAALRILEKTPKNSLRIPFLEQVFPGALYVFLYRDPRESMSSIMEAWRDGAWVTYPELPDWQGPWSFLLPPGWQAYKGKPLGEIAGLQWSSANTQILHDLQSVDSRRWMGLDYAGFLQDPRLWIRRICAFAGLSFDKGLQMRTATPLPLSRLTLTPPAAGKWRKNEQEIGPQLPHVLPLFEEIAAFVQRHTQANPHPLADLPDAQIAPEAAGVKPGRNDPCPCGSGQRYKSCHGKLARA